MDGGSSVEDIISEAMDHIALEQIAALNTSHLSDAVLPTDLESRFRKLKSFPGANPKPHRTPPPPQPLDSNKHEEVPSCRPDRVEKVVPTSPKDKTTPPPEPAVDGKKDSFDDDGEGEVSIPVPRPVEPKSRGGFVPSPPASPGSWRDSPSPPRRQACCFGLSPKRNSGKKKKKGGKEEKGDDMLLDLGEFSLKEQRRKMKKALAEQEKVNREVEKLVDLVKQASARMDFSSTAMDDLLSDDEKLM